MELGPTFKGYIEDENDALLVLQAILDGRLRHIPRRPYEVERRYLIVSGNIFVFVEEISGIKRWTDGVSWSPSRISGKFLMYRELDKSPPAHPGSRKRGSVVLFLPAGSPASVGGNGGSAGSAAAGAAADVLPSELSSLPSPPQLPSKYTGFVKKTMSVKIKTSRTAAPETLHIVSYYSLEDVHGGHLTRPSDSPFFAETKASPLLMMALESTALGSHSKACGNSNSSSSGASSNNSPLVSGINGTGNGKIAFADATAAAAAAAANTNHDTNNNNTAGSMGERSEMQQLLPIQLHPPWRTMQPLPSLRIPSLTSMFTQDDHHHPPPPAKFTRFGPTQPPLNPYLQGKFAAPQPPPPPPPPPPNLRYVSLPGCTYYSPVGGPYYPLPPVATPNPVLAQVKHYNDGQPSAPKASAADASADATD